MKIKLTKKNKISDIERAIVSVGAPEISDSDFKEQMSKAKTLVIDPACQAQLKKLGITPEQLRDMMLDK